MIGRFSLLAALLILFGAGIVIADDAKPAPKTDPAADAKAARGRTTLWDK